MGQINFDTANKSFREIITNGSLYQVPKYQRDYSWGNEHWEDLWEDIWELHNTPKNEREEHYMGYLVLQRMDSGIYTIIDGQQRLTTLSLLIVAALYKFKESQDTPDKERLEIYRSNFITVKKGSSLESQNRLELNRNNNNYFKNDLCSLLSNPRQRNIKRTEHLLRKAKEFFKKEIDSKKLTGEKLGEFIEAFADSLLFTVITVGTDINAYKVFETLNARGVKLSTPDLLKNYIFSLIDPDNSKPQVIDDSEEKWSNILDQLGNTDFSKFVRAEWNRRNPLANKTNLFKTIRNKIDGAKEAEKYLAQLYESAPIYASLENHLDEQWNQSDKIVKECLKCLKLFNIVQPYGILMSAYEKYEPKDFSKICKYILVISIRYNAICNLPAKDQEKIYNRAATAIWDKTSVSGIKDILLKDLYVNDKRFKNSFIHKTMPTTQSSKKVYYLLSSIESHCNPTNPMNTIDDSPEYTIEHILPNKGSHDDSYWRDSFGHILEQNVQRIGNMTLVVSRDNRDVGTMSFTKKKEILRSLSLEIVKQICECKDWNPSSLDDYQKWLAERATQVWRIDEN